MNINWSDIQCRRLRELNAPQDVFQLSFANEKERDLSFQKCEKQLIKESRRLLTHFKDEIRVPALCSLQNKLSNVLTEEGFVQVTTPTIMSRTLLEKMTIDRQHPLYNQVFWLDNNKCLRPMLAPHLYYVLKDLLRLWPRPVRIFEVGSCFRKESQGAQHANEFTMLNLVEMGLPESQRQQRLNQLTQLIMNTTGIKNFQLKHETSSVYGETVDIVAGKDQLELGSGAMGPHPLDAAWRIMETWVGIGFGLERLLMIKEQRNNLAPMGRSLTYLNGIRLNI